MKSKGIETMAASYTQQQSGAARFELAYLGFAKVIMADCALETGLDEDQEHGLTSFRDTQIA